MEKLNINDLLNAADKNLLNAILKNENRVLRCSIPDIINTNHYLRKTKKYNFNNVLILIYF